MIVLSLVHVRNLHPGANLHPGCIFGHVNGVLRICISNSGGGANLHRVQIVHINAKCLRVIPCKYQKIVATHSHRFYSNTDFWVEGQKRNIETSLCFSIFSLVSMETGHQIYKTCIFLKSGTKSIVMVINKSS